MLLKNPENLISKKHEGYRLELALKLNEPLATAYYLKEELRQMWSQKTKKDAERFILSWIYRAEQSGIKMLIKFSKTIRKFFRKILAHYDYPISTGILEGTNNKIKTLTKRSYGFRDKQYFKMKVMGLHRARYQLIG